MAKARDFYQTLGVARTASPDEIKRAYRTLAKKYHPDRNPGNADAEAKFKDVQAAYQTLSDTEKRAQYDRYGEAGVGKVATGPTGESVYTWGSGSKVNVDDLEDLFSAFGGSEHASIFDQFFAGQQRRGRSTTRAPAPRAADEEREIWLTFDQAVNGTTLAMQLTTGQNGSGERVEVKIPKGVDDGQRIRVRGRVPNPYGGPAGDLILRCRIHPHPYFRREGNDVHLDVPVSITEAALGAKVDLPTLSGFVTLSIPPGTASGAKLRLRGRGIRSEHSGDAGDQIVNVQIVAPHELTEEERRLLENFQNLRPENPRTKAPWAQRTSS